VKWFKTSGLLISDDGAILKAHKGWHTCRKQKNKLFKLPQERHRLAMAAPRTVLD
jgi:hypothetical protein